MTANRSSSGGQCSTSFPSAWVVAVVAVGIGLAGVVLLLRPGLPAGPGFPFWPLFPFGFFVLVVLAFAGLRLLAGSRCGWGYRGWGPSAEAMVRERYARGEIDADQMRRMLGELAGS